MKRLTQAVCLSTDDGIIFAGKLEDGRIALAVGTTSSKKLRNTYMNSDVARRLRDALTEALDGVA